MEYSQSDEAAELALEPVEHFIDGGEVDDFDLMEDEADHAQGDLVPLAVILELENETESNSSGEDLD